MLKFLINVRVPMGKLLSPFLWAVCFPFSSALSSGSRLFASLLRRLAPVLGPADDRITGGLGVFVLGWLFVSSVRLVRSLFVNLFFS